MNKVIVVGRLTRDVELRQGNCAVASFTVAVSRGKKDGEDKGSDFIPVKILGKMAENCDKYLAKGRLVAVEGSYHTGSYTNKEGKTVYTTEVLADKVEFLEWGDKKTAPKEETAPSGFEEINETIPF